MNRHAEIVSASLRSIPKEVSEKRHAVAPMADQHLLTQKNEGIPTKRHSELVSASCKSSYIRMFLPNHQAIRCP